MVRLLHQTICNNISDTNCIGDVSRFAIHFEPLMLLPIPLLYLIAPSPKTLMLFQAVVVASGAFPVYWDRLPAPGPARWRVWASPSAYLLLPCPSNRRYSSISMPSPCRRHSLCSPSILCSPEITWVWS